MLCKADLVSLIVGEFPELQGVMGRWYAQVEGMSARHADAIRDHYKPVGPSDAVPTDKVAIAVALADKLDQLVAFFAAGEKPTGSGDPFALRRAALGVIRIILESKVRIKLNQSEDLLSFFADRLKIALKDKGIRHDLIDAVFSLGGEDDLVRLVARVEALQSFLRTDDGANLLAGYKRAANIPRDEEKKDKRSYAGDVRENLLTEPAEKDLFAALTMARASATLRASGFSQSTILPAAAAAMAASACRWFGSAMSTASMSLRSIAARQSVAVSSHSHCAAVLCSSGESRPQMSLRRIR